MANYVILNQMKEKKKKILSENDKLLNMKIQYILKCAPHNKNNYMNAHCRLFVNKEIVPSDDNRQFVEENHARTILYYVCNCILS